MKKNKICRVLYDPVYDGFVLEISNNGKKDWGTVMIAKCLPDKEGDTTLIHYTFLTELLKIVSYGYELIN